MRGKASTLQQVAAQAGVAVSTVSLALRNDPRLPAATRARIQTIARELGYRPNPAIATLMTHVRSRRRVLDRETIAFVVPIPAGVLARHPTTVPDAYWVGASARATQLGFQLEKVWAKEEGMSGRRLSDILHARNIRGVLIGSGVAARGHLSLDWSKFAAAIVGYSVWKPNLHRAAVNYFDSLMLALRTLKRRGYRRIGLVVHALTNERVNHQLTAAFHVFRDRLPRKERVEPLVTKRFDAEHFAPWLRRENPDAVVANAPAVMTWIRHCGKRIPDDVGFVHLQWEEGCAPCAGIRHNIPHVGAAAIDLIAAQLHHNETGIPAHPKLVLTPGEWIEGATARARD